MCRVWQRNQRFQMKTKLIWNFQHLISFNAPWTCPILMKKTQNPQYLHVIKHQNTRKIRIKRTKIHFFLRLTKYWKYIRGCLSRSHFTFSDSRTDFKLLYRQIVVRVKGDQIYKIHKKNNGDFIWTRTSTVANSDLFRTHS